MLLKSRIYQPVLILIVLSIVLAACGGDGGSSATPLPSFTPLPPVTPTPRSTALPPVPTPVPVGGEDKPLHLAFVAEQTAATRRVTTALGEALVEEMRNFRFGGNRGLELDVQLLDSHAQAIERLCTTGDAAVFVDIFTYVAAAERCDVTPVLRVQKGAGRNRTTGTNFEFVVNDDFITGSPRFFSASAGFNTRFCAMSLDSIEGFIHPALALRAIALNETTRDILTPFIGPNADVIDLLNPESIEIILPGEDTFETDVEMVRALEGGQNIRKCETLALPAGRFEEIVEELEEDDVTLRAISVFEIEDDALLWPELPYEVLVFPPNNLFPEVLREEVLRALTTLEEDDNAFKRNLDTLVEHDALIEMPEDNYAAFREWLGRTGWDMAEPVR